MKKIIKFLYDHWSKILLLLTLTTVIVLNFHFGKSIIGNDNFSPELNPTLTLERNLANPTWRSYRVLGIQSDSEQADWWRAGAYTLLEKILPIWIVSQGYIFFTLLIGAYSISQIIPYFVKSKNTQLLEFIAGITYLFSTTTLWIYSYPVHLFVAAYSFSPLVIWRVLKSLDKPSKLNHLLLIFSSIMLGTSALTATMFIVCLVLIIFISIAWSFKERPKINNFIIVNLILLLPHLFWIPGFILYVKDNAGALQNSSINREITTTTIETEKTYNNTNNILRGTGAWLEVKEDGVNFTLPYRDWYRNNSVSYYLGFVIPTIAFLGLLSTIINFKKSQLLSILLLSFIPITGYLLIKGSNPPFNQFYLLLDKYVPLFHQVFRWGSSKFWPLLAIPLPILVSYFFSNISNHYLKTILAICFAISISIYSYPIWQGQLIRPDVYINIPQEYLGLASYLSTSSNTRIHTSPNTNTRYFRKYDWGFWGSVFLNYQIPNPTTEKALIIGSYANESAFTVIDSLYHSVRQQAYANGLNRFNMGYVLSDRSATNKGLNDSYSYPYDWDLENNMTTSNPNLVKLNQFPNLSLFDVPNNLNQQAIPLNQHNPTTLNSIFALNNDPNNYYTSKTGSIYPLGLNFSSFNTTATSLDLESIYQGESENYAISQSDSNLKLLHYNSDNSISLSSFLPSISINGQVAWEPKKTLVNFKKDTPLLSIGDRTIYPNSSTVVDGGGKNITPWDNPTKLKSSLGRIRLTDCQSNNQGDGHIISNNPISVQVNSHACLSADTNIEESGFIEPQFMISSDNDIQAKICIHSYLENKCLNNEQILYVTKSPQLIKSTLSNVIKSKDNLALFITINPTSQTQLFVDDFVLIKYSPGDKINIPVTEKNSDTNISLSQGDKITVSLPLESSNLNFPFTTLLPFTATCSERGELGTPTYMLDTNGGTTITSNNCFDGFYKPLGKVNGDIYPLLLVAGQAINKQGIPLEINLKQGYQIHKPFTDLFRSNQESFITSFVPTLTGTNEYTAELDNKGIGKTSSINTIKSFVSLPIPESWLAFKFNSQDESSVIELPLSPLTTRDTGIYFGQINEPSIISIPQAVSPYWIAYSINAKPNFLTSYLGIFNNPKFTEKTAINSWKQSWQVNQIDQEKPWVVVVFYPNLIAYIGLLILVLGILIILVSKKR